MGTRRIAQNRSGATAIEYALICALIALACIGAIALLGGGSNGMWTKLDSKVSTAL
jgi:pilus assembly protein Flp/PilA